MNYNTFIKERATLSYNNSYVIEDNTVRISKGTIKASSAVTYKDKYRVSKKNKRFVDKLIEEYQTTNKVQRVSKALKEQMSGIIANLVFSSSVNKSVLYSRSKNTKQSKVISNIIEFLASKKYLFNVIGKANQYEENSSWFHATDKFILDSIKEEITVIIIENGSFLVLRDEEGNVIDEYKDKRNALKLKRLSQGVNAYNTLWLDNSATLDGMHIVPFSYRIFNKQLDLGGRFYRGSYQGLPKKDRARILINGEETCEPDFPSLHYNILYSWKGIQLDYDPYLIDGYDRKVIKIASFVLLNCEDLFRFKANVTKSGKPEVKEAYAKWKAEAKHEDNKPDFLKGFIEGMPDNINGADLLKSLREKHSVIAEYFGIRDIGLKLQFIDSEIMSHILLTLSGLRIPVLPVHDSLICSKSNRQIVTSIMQQCYTTITNNHIKV